MSKSKRAAQGSVSPAPRVNGNLFRAKTGGLRTGWLLAASLFGYALLALAVRYGLVRALAALFGAWGIDASNARLAPAWARLLYAWHGSAVTALFALLSLGLARVLRRLWLGEGGGPRLDVGRLGRWALAGLLGALAILLIGLLPDSLRPEWPLTAPRLSPGLVPLCAVSLLSALGEEAFTKRVLFDGLKARWGRLWATATACAAFFLLGGGLGGSVVSGVNVALLGLACCLLYDRFGLWAAVGLRWGWSVATVFLMGWGGGDSAVYRFYGVSEAVMTGGDAGPMYGLWTTLFLAGLLAWLLLSKRQTD